MDFSIHLYFNSLGESQIPIMKALSMIFVFVIFLDNALDVSELLSVASLILDFQFYLESKENCFLICKTL